MSVDIPKTLNFITSNKNKLAEVEQILAPALEKSQITLTNQDVEVEEVQGSVADVTVRKAESAARKVNGPVLVEDTALVFNALGSDLPGPYIKYFLTALGVADLHRMLAGFSEKSAIAICTFAYTAGPSQRVWIFQGQTKGRIVEARGPTTFGWDAAFEYDGQTYAEMLKEDKNKISHRGKALAKLRSWLEGGGDEA